MKLQLKKIEATIKTDKNYDYLNQGKNLNKFYQSVPKLILTAVLTAIIGIGTYSFIEKKQLDDLTLDLAISGQYRVSYSMYTFFLQRELNPIDIKNRMKLELDDVDLSKNIEKTTEFYKKRERELNKKAYKNEDEIVISYEKINSYLNEIKDYQKSSEIYNLTEEDLLVISSSIQNYLIRIHEMYQDGKINKSNYEKIMINMKGINSNFKEINNKISDEKIIKFLDTLYVKRKLIFNIFKTGDINTNKAINSFKYLRVASQLRFDIVNTLIDKNYGKNIKLDETQEYKDFNKNLKVELDKIRKDINEIF